MDYRGVVLVGAVLGAGALASAAACSGPDPGAITFAERDTQGSSGDPGSTSGGTPGTSSGVASSGGTEGGAADPVFGTSTFAYQDPGVTANDANAAHAGNVEGKNCIVAGCHLDGAKPWVFAGTVYSAAQGGATVPKAEIRVVGPDGADVGSTYTDANGNFWLEKAGTTIPAQSKVGVRKEGGKPMVMATLLQPTDRGCSSAEANCHGTAATGSVYAP